MLNHDPAAITVKGDAPWNTVEAFIAAASVEDRTGARFLHNPQQGAAPAVLNLLGGHIDAVAVSPAEVARLVGRIHCADGRIAA